MFETVTLSPTAIEVLGQLFVSGPTWDGNIVSKNGRGELIRAGLAGRNNGWAFLTEEGVVAAVKWKVNKENYTKWYRKAKTLC